MNKKIKIALYMHGGSGNHGCEALVRTILSLLPKNCDVRIFSKRPEEDRKYIDNNINVVTCGISNGKTLSSFIAKIRIKLFKQKYAFVENAYKSLLKYADKNTIAISIGGDNYCYDGMPEVLAILNKKLKNKGARTILLGCSIEPTLIKTKDIQDDLSRYDLITARESITYNALLQAGVKTKIVLLPDSAFILPTVMNDLPFGFLEGNTIGINISPLVLSCEKGQAILYKAYSNLVEYILKETSMNIALIPHVVWKKNNDDEPICRLFNQYKQTERVIKIGDCSATQLKGYIARCKYFIGARTHSTIAAYSSLVPTLVIGYSVKSKGIAKDLFGTDENYVCGVENIKNDMDLVNAFQWLEANSESIENKLKNTIPDYKEKVYLISEEIKKMINN